jgi:hypothetical protein
VDYVQREVLWLLATGWCRWGDLVSGRALAAHVEGFDILRPATRSGARPGDHHGRGDEGQDPVFGRAGG